MQLGSSRLAIGAHLLMLCALLGCDHTRDVTTTDRVRAGGMIGRCYQLQQDAAIVRYGRSPYLNLERLASAGTDKGKEVVGVAHRGTQLHVEKAVLFNYGWLPTPALAPSDIPMTVARVVDGPHAGKRVTTDSLGLGAHGSAVNEAFFQPCPEPGSETAERPQTNLPMHRTGPAE